MTLGLMPAKSHDHNIIDKMASDIVERWKALHSVSFVYRSYHLPMPDPGPSTLTV